MSLWTLEDALHRRRAGSHRQPRPQPGRAFDEVDDDVHAAGIDEREADRDPGPRGRAGATVRGARRDAHTSCAARSHSPSRLIAAPPPRAATRRARFAGTDDHGHSARRQRASAALDDLPTPVPGSERVPTLGLLSAGRSAALHASSCKLVYAAWCWVRPATLKFIIGILSRSTAHQLSGISGRLQSSPAAAASSAASTPRTVGDCSRRRTRRREGGPGVTPSSTSPGSSS